MGKIYMVAFFSATALFVTSCAKNQDGPADANPYLMALDVFPGDNMSAYTQGDYYVTVEATGIRLDDRDETSMAALLDALKNSITLATYPALTPVPVTLSVELPHAGVYVYDSFGVVHVVPQTTLSPSTWYVLRLSSVPAGLDPNSSGWTTLGGSAIGSRFSVGSAPRLTSIEVCPSEDASGSEAQLRFSEPIKTAGLMSAALTVTEGGVSKSCDTNFSITTADPTDDFILHCSPTFSSTATIAFSISAGQISSLANIPVSSGNFTMTLDSLPLDSDCRVYTAP